jgi:hypothetical protein
MSRITALVSSIVAGAVAIGIVVLATNLVMPLTAAKEKGVGAGPWFLVWGMIAVTGVCTAVLIAFLVSTLMKPSRP